MNMYTVPLGFRFEPTDEELIRAFLLPKAKGLQLPWDGIVERNLYGENAEPWLVLGDAPAQSWQTKREGRGTKSTIFAFTTTPKAANDKRVQRRAGGGTWSGQTGPTKIKNSDTGEVIGCTRYLTFKRSKSGDDVASTDSLGRWNMHEYLLSEDLARESGNPDAGNLVVCKISKTVKDCGGGTARLGFFPAAVENRKRGGAEIEKEVCKKQKRGGEGLEEAEEWMDEDLDGLYLDLDSVLD